MTFLELRSGPMRLALRPDLGASIAGLWLASEPVLRSVEPAALAAPRESGCFALAPYSNRLGFRRFHWAGREYTTAPNFPGSAHSLHGVAWRRAWRVDEAGADRALLSCTHRPDADWPFAFTLRQSLRLHADALEATLTLVNDHDQAAPAGLGWHPYFPKRARSAIRLAAAGRWECDADQLPVRRVASAGVDADVAALDLDHCFDGWSGDALIADERLTLRLRSSLGCVVVYTPPQQAHYCVEPVSHVNDAIRFADPAAAGLRTLAPGEPLTATLRLQVQRAG